MATLGISREFFQIPKVWQAGIRGGTLYVEGLAYTEKHNTLGTIGNDDAELLGKQCPDGIEVLLVTGLWHATDSGYQMADELRRTRRTLVGYVHPYTGSPDLVPLWNLTSTNPDVARATNERRQGRVRTAAGSATPAQVAERVAYYSGRCWMCGEPGDQIDHVIPLARGGTKWPANLRPACRRCNSRKGTRSWRSVQGVR